MKENYIYLNITSNNIIKLSKYSILNIIENMHSINEKLIILN